MNYSVRELESLKPRIREDLVFSVQEHGEERVCVIEDSVASKFYRVGFDEYRFFRSLDGTQTVAAILSRMARDANGDTYSEHEALQILRWLKENHLLTVESARTKTDRELDQRAMKSMVTWLNPLIVRVPLGRPDRFFMMLASKLRPLLGGAGFLIWLGVVAFGAAQVAMDWERFRRGFDQILARDNWLWLGLVWAALKVLHEIGHGIFCRHFGARVREVGAIFVMFIPMGYVDATASIGIASKWKRIIVSSAGMYVELFVAALAAWWWSNTPEGQLSTILHDTVVTGSVLTLFFNANPLMRFDGYYILSDLLGIPNLATRSRSWFQRAAGWVLLGGRKLRPAMPRSREEWIVAVYGVAAWMWQLLVLAGLLLGASVLLKGGGLLLAVVAALAWLVLPAAMFIRQVAGLARGGAGTFRNLSIRLTLVVALACTAVFFPYYKTVVAPGVVEFADTRVVRAECPGFVEKIHVTDGAIVQEGALLIELRNDEVTSAVSRAERNLEAQEQRARHAYARDDVAAYQAELAKLDGLRKGHAENQAYLATLKIRAPIAGRVSSRQLSRMQGAFVQSGSEILRVGESMGRELKVAVAQETEPHFRSAIGRTVTVRIEGRSTTFDATLKNFAGEASRTLPHFALTAPADGPLAVRRAESGTQQSEKYELADPHFTATIVLPANAAPLADGELARVKFRSSQSVTFFNEVRSSVARWAGKFGG
jgi:putative peptide zinc metalloprotease protein